MIDFDGLQKKLDAAVPPRQIDPALLARLRAKLKDRWPLLKPKCRWEGEVLERCDACPAVAQARHVRQCLYTGHEHDRCTRGQNNGAVAACLNCPHHESDG